MLASLHRAQAVLVLLVQAQPALVTQAVGRRRGGVLVHVLALHVLGTARLGGVGGVGAGGRGGLAFVGQTRQHDEVAGLAHGLVQVVRGRQGVVAGMAGGILHVRLQGLGLVVEVGVDPVVDRLADMLQRRRPDVLIRVAHDLGAIGEQHLEGRRVAGGLVGAGAVGQELPVAVLVGPIETGAGHVLVAVLVEELLVVVGNRQGLVGRQRQVRIVRAQTVLGQIVATGEIFQHILGEGPVAAPHALLLLGCLGTHEDGQVAVGVGPGAVDHELLDAGRFGGLTVAGNVALGLGRRLSARADVASILVLAGNDFHVAGEELGVIVVQHVQLHQVLRGGLGARRALGHGGHRRVQLVDVGRHGVGRGLLLLGGHGLALVQLERVGHGHDLVVLLAGESGVLEAAVAAGGLAGHLLPVADAGLVVPVAHEPHDGALDALLFLVHEAVGVHIVPHVAVDEHRQLLGEAGVEGALVVHAVGQVVVGLQVADRVRARQDAAGEVGVVGDLLGHDGVHLVDLLVLGVDVVGQRGLEGGEVGVVAGAGALHMEAAGHVLAGVVHHLDGVAGQVRGGRREGRIAGGELGLARLIGGHHVGIGLDGFHLAGGQRDDLGGRELADHADRHGALLQGHQVGGGKRRAVGVGHAVGLEHLVDVLARSGRMVDLAAHEHVARQVVEVIDTLGVGVGPQLVILDDEAAADIAAPVGAFRAGLVVVLGVHMGRRARLLAADLANRGMGVVEVVLPLKLGVLAHIGAAAVAQAVAVGVGMGLLAQHLVAVGAGDGVDVGILVGVGAVVQVQAVAAAVAAAVAIAVGAGLVGRRGGASLGVARPVVGAVLVARIGLVLVGAGLLTRVGHLGALAVGEALGLLGGGQCHPRQREAAHGRLGHDAGARILAGVVGGFLAGTRLYGARVLGIGRLARVLRVGRVRILRLDRGLGHLDVLAVLVLAAAVEVGVLHPVAGVLQLAHAGLVQGVVVVGAAGANQVHLVVGAGHHVAAAGFHQMQLAVRVVVVGPVAVEEEDVVVLVFQQLVAVVVGGHEVVLGQDDAQALDALLGLVAVVGVDTVVRGIGLVLAVVVLVVPRLTHQARAVGRHEAGVHGVLVLADGEVVIEGAGHRLRRRTAVGVDSLVLLGPAVGGALVRPAGAIGQAGQHDAPGGVVLRDLALDGLALLDGARAVGVNLVGGLDVLLIEEHRVVVGLVAAPHVGHAVGVGVRVLLLGRHHGLDAGVHHIVGGGLGLEGGHEQRGHAVGGLLAVHFHRVGGERVLVLLRCRVPCAHGRGQLIEQVVTGHVVQLGRTVLGERLQVLVVTGQHGHLAVAQVSGVRHR